MEPKEPKQITVKLILAYIIGLFMLLGSLGTFSTSIVGGIIFLILGIMIFPMTAKIYEQKFNFKISTGLKVIIFFVLMGIYSVSSPKAVETVAKVETNKTNIETPVVQKQAKPVEPELTVTAVELAKDFEENEIKANGIYKDKLSKITGRIYDIGEMFGQTSVTLSSGKEYAVTQTRCYFKDKSEIEKIANMKKGDSVVIVGTIDGKSLDVTVSNCKFIN